MGILEHRKRFKLSPLEWKSNMLITNTNDANSEYKKVMDLNHLKQYNQYYLLIREIFAVCIPYLYVVPMSFVISYT